MKLRWILALLVTEAAFGQTQVLFEPAQTDKSLFPTDNQTVNADIFSGQIPEKTGKRVNLPASPDCSAPFASCSDTTLLNKLDGFSVSPRIRMCFSGPINAQTLTGGASLIAFSGSPIEIPLEKLFYDPPSQCAYGKPSAVLAPGTRYALLVKNTIKDTNGAAVAADPGYVSCLASTRTYCKDVRKAVTDRTGIAGASVFTTLSATDWLEKARSFVNSPLYPLVVQPLGKRDGYSIGSLRNFKWIAQVNSNGATQSFDVPIQDLTDVDKVAFGLYFSPHFIANSGPDIGTIPQLPTSFPTVVPQLPFVATISYHVFLPSPALKRNGGFPVAIYGHGVGDSQFGATTAIASSLAKKGIALIAFEIQGHGFGFGSRVQFTSGNSPVTILTPGRGLPLSANGGIGPIDGCVAPGPVGTRDCQRQTVVDIFTLIRAVKNGSLDLPLDSSRIFYIGQSFGSVFGTPMLALEPSIKAAVLNVGGASTVDIARLQQERLLAIAYLAGRNPVFNDPTFVFNDNFVYRGMAPLVNTVPLASEIQAAFEVADWLNMPGDPLAYAPRLRGKRILFQFAKGDEEVPNPSNSALIRAAGGQASSRYYRFDLAKQTQASQLPIQPHRFLANPEVFSTPAQASVALAAQQQVAEFLASDGQTIPDANQFLLPPFSPNMGIFETPSVLPEELNFPRRPPTL